MSGDRGNGEEEVSVPLDSIPDPTLRYEVRDDGPVVAETNRAFETTFGTPETGTALRTCLNDSHVGLATDAAGDVCSSLVDSGSVDVTEPTSNDSAVRVRSSAGGPIDDGDGGLLTVAPAPSETDGSVGVENIATVVSHDLRNPLDVAKAHLRAARERGDPEYFDQVAEAHDRMERIIDDVLTLARGDGTVSPSESVDVGSVARDAWSTVETGDATLDVASELPTVEADASRLRRLFENLFRNSVEHGTDDGRVHVRVGPMPDGGFVVGDDGVGIAEADRDRVFDPGYSSSDRGAGLGLTIVERIAEAHGWCVSVPPEASEGARFEFHPRDDEP